MLRVLRCDNGARSWLWFGAVLALLALWPALISGCEDDPGAPPPGAFSPRSQDSPNDQESSAEDADEYAGLGDFEFSSETLPPAEHVYFAYGEDIWRISEDEDLEVVAEGLSIAGFSASATGERVAVLSLDRDADDRERMELSILRPDGTTVFDLSSLSDHDVDLRAISAIEAVAFNPAGDTLAVTHQNGAMSLVTVDGEIRQLLQPSTAHHPGRLTWSADGQFLAYLDPWMPDRASSLYVHVPARDIREELVDPSSEEHGIVRARWVPGTSYLAMVKESGSTIPHGGDLFLFDAATGRQELLMSSGEIAPVAGIVDLAPSPDGHWLAVTAFAPGDAHPGFAGLWLINLESGIRTEIGIEGDDLVTDLWWLGDDLLVRTIDEPLTSLPGTYTGRESFRLLEINPESETITERFDSDESSEN